MALSQVAQDIVSAVAAEKTQTASAIMLLNQLNILIQGVQSQEDIDALKTAAAELAADSDQLRAAVTAYTPAV